jgi:hypothetical protein
MYISSDQEAPVGICSKEQSRKITLNYNIMLE